MAWRLAVKEVRSTCAGAQPASRKKALKPVLTVTATLLADEGVGRLLTARRAGA